MKKFDVALFGPVFVDTVLSGFTRWPMPGEEVFAQSLLREAGGGCFNTACGLARLGGSAICFTVVGRQESEWVLDRVRHFGVCTDGIRFSNLPTGTTVAVSLADDRSFFTYEGANRELPDWLESPGLAGELAAARHVHFAYPLPAVPGVRIVRELHALGSTVSLDVGWREDWLKDEASWSLLRELDWFFPNEAEAVRMTRRSDHDEILRAFASFGAHRVAMKLGAGGAALWDGSRAIHQPAVPVKAVDTTGAGDAFDAGFLHAHLAGLPDPVCLERGVICGSLSARKAGSLEALPTLDEVLQFHEHDTKR